MTCVSMLMCVLATVATLANGATATIEGVVRDATQTPIPGVVVEVTADGKVVAVTTTDAVGRYRIAGLSPQRVVVAWSMVNFARQRRVFDLRAGLLRQDVELLLTMDADVTVSGTRSFANIADLADPSVDLSRVAQSASQGAITGRQLEGRPFLRPGEVLETVPGLVISQHSGEGKANQYYLRGFNLDHGTDFATSVAGIPVNMPSHGHGQGWSDLNFLVPELVSGVQFSKGPYFAEHGDFATAGAATINYVTMLSAPAVSVTAGPDSYGRVLAAASPRIGAGRVLAAVELQRTDGPFDTPERFEKLNCVVRYSRGDAASGWVASAMAYRSTWNASDQIPDRAVADGRLSRFGGIDPSGGGVTSRYSGSLEMQRSGGESATKFTAYVLRSNLDLFSNFTFFLDDPVAGDQFEQTDRRVVAGARLQQRRIQRWWSRPVQNSWSLHVRNDAIGEVGLYRTEERRRLSTVRRDSVTQSTAGITGQTDVEVTDWFRPFAAVRIDGFRFHVAADEPINGGTRLAAVVSPKVGTVLGPWRGTEFYANAGYGFHSNDARGTTIRVDPVTGEPVERVSPIARGRGAELGVRWTGVPRLQTTVALWRLALDSELLFVGDAGTTTVGSASRRHGIEIATYYRPLAWLTLDSDLSFSSANFIDGDSLRRPVPGAVTRTMSAGVEFKGRWRFDGALRLRHVGPRALSDDGLVTSKASTRMNAELRYRFRPGVHLVAELFNAFNAAGNDVEYFYESRLPGEAQGSDDVHFRAATPRRLRAGFAFTF